MCAHEGRGYGFRLELREDAPDYEFCSPECREAAIRICDAKGIMKKQALTDMEKQAIKEARHSLADVLNKLGLMGAFENRTAADIDKIIEACWEGCRVSMHRQSAMGEVPF